MPALFGAATGEGSKSELDELILQEQPRALRLFPEVVLCGKRAS
jgi:hypothetical protein